ncbi:hypothetical protein ACFPZ0_15695 [Streptomonospora nanhaiensis]|uniref:Uncharacterized protein n=1 Tax=Streptomonospora nanhaiensis TaxID=1323731 RepID=A0A853BGW1_9ACTN|nr:hypothetical protein [Streptomonospora nanhaiensis]MBV2363388.1 hypothetical protein [Streptomonospora nanhaiensis]MBX9389716.1 hypothetical protein [Streptomonospora nanhaiensis]NYI94553.1 hypothetical protein [Streptomonospora nanhaiensis]
MTVETPPSGIPGLAAHGHRLDNAPVELLWVRALNALRAELRSCGVEARVDGVIGTVEAVAHDGASRVQRAVLRPHRGRLWWWLHWHGDPSVPPPYRAPLAPAARTADAARRIAGVLARTGA